MNPECCRQYSNIYNHGNKLWLSSSTFAAVAILLKQIATVRPKTTGQTGIHAFKNDCCELKECHEINVMK